MTKVLDTQLFYYYNKNDNLRITDLHQGVVWGAATQHTGMHPDLVNRFDYDGDYGTVLNRFLVQGVMKHPLTVYGTGGQTRAFIHIQNMVECVHLAVSNPPAKDQRVRVWNQTTEQLNLMDIAKLVSSATGAEIRLYANPRVEAVSNGLAACMNNIHSLGLEPVRLNEDAIMDIYALAHKHIGRVNAEKIYCTSTWRKGMRVDTEGVKYGEEQVADTGRAATR
jgi:UDP-sulfoquinovose synthase